MILFAVMLPFLFSCCSLTFDGARILTKKARLADALNEAALAIATSSSSIPYEEETARFKILLNRFISVYLPAEKIISSDIVISYMTDPDTGTNLPVFDIYATIDVQTFLPLDIIPSFSSRLELSNKGKAGKGLQTLSHPTDYVFIVDFSDSMNEESAEIGLTRLALLKKIIQDITHTALETHPETTFSIVPFDVGVPVLWDSNNRMGENELSDRSDAVVGCSVLMVPNKYQHSSLGMSIGYDINYAFWANKNQKIRTLQTPSNSAHSLPYTFEEVNQMLDVGRYNYFKNIALPSLQQDMPSANWTTLVNYGWCKLNAGISENHQTRAAYSCEKNAENSIFTTKNQQIIQDEIERAKRVFTEASSNSIYNLAAIDVEATLNGMFDKTNVITFPLVYHRYGTDDFVAPYGAMCTSAGSDARYWYGAQLTQLKYIKPNAYLIEPTNDLSVLGKFQNMQAGGGTHSSTGLIRAVPEIVKGKNPRKVMVIISDGDDNPEYQPVTNALHSGRTAGNRVCDHIKKGVK